MDTKIVFTEKKQYNLEKLFPEYKTYKGNIKLMSDGKIIILTIKKDENYDSIGDAKLITIDDDSIEEYSLKGFIDKDNFSYSDMVLHKNGLLIFVQKRRDQEKFNLIEDYILWLGNNDFSKPVKIVFENKLEYKTWKHNYGFHKIYPQIDVIGFSDNHIIPIALKYDGMRDEKQVTFLSIDFETCCAKWLQTVHKDFLTLNRYYVEKAKNHTVSNELKEKWINEEQSKEGTLDNYYEHYNQYLFNQLYLKNDSLVFYSIGSRYSPRYGMEDALLGEIKKENNQFNIDKLELLWYADIPNSKKSFGRMGIIASSCKYVIIEPFYKTSDLWGFREKVFSLDDNKLYDVDYPRGFNRHNLIEHNGSYFLAYGVNSKREALITIFLGKKINKEDR